MDTASVNQLKTYRVKIEGGVLFVHFLADIDSETVTEALNDAMELVAASQQLAIPLILTAEDESKTLLALNQLSKIVKLPIINHISIACLVDVDTTAKSILEPMNRFFFGNRMRFCKTLTEAKELVEPYKSSTSTILERSE